MRKKRLLPIITAFIVLVITSMPSLTSSAQNDEALPDSIVTLALMAVASDRLDGVLDNSDLANIYDLVDEYYETKMNMKSDFYGESQRTALEKEKGLILTALDEKIKIISIKNNPKKTIVRHFFLTEMPTYGYDRDAQINSMLKVLSWKYEPSQEVIDLLNTKLAEDEENNVEKSLDGHTANTIEGGDQLVDGNYDFSAGLSEEAYNEQLSQTKPLVFINNGPRDVVVSVEYYAAPKSAALSAPGLNLTVPKNNSVTANGFPQGNYTFCYHWQTDQDMDGDGLMDYDKMVTHIWLSSASSDDPGSAPEVYVNSGGSSASPLGRCDGFKGEALATQDIMTQEIFTEDNPQQWEAVVETAEDVAVLPEEQPSEENLPQDGETGDEDTEPSSDADFWDQGDGSSDEDEDPQGGTDPDEGDTDPGGGGTDPDEGGQSTGLSPAEQINQGQHTYSITGSTDGAALSEPVIESHSFDFTGSGVNATFVQGGGGFLSKTAPNVYSDGSTTITFTESGWVAVGSIVWTMDGSIHPYNFTGTLIQ